MRSIGIITTGALAAALLLAGCGSPTSDPTTSASAEPTTSATAPSATPTPTPTPTPSASASGESVAIWLGRLNASVAAVQSLRVAGSINSGGVPTQMDVFGAADGSVMRGKISSAVSGTAEFIKVAEGSYITGDDTYWRGQEATEEQLNYLRDKWVRFPDGSTELDVYAPNTYLALFADLTPTDLTGPEHTTLEGVPAVKFTEKAILSEGALWLSDDEAGRPLRVEVTRTGMESHLNYGDWNAPVDIQAPPAASVVQG